MNGKALERDVSTHTNHKYHNAWMDRVVSDQTNSNDSTKDSGSFVDEIERTVFKFLVLQAYCGL